MCGRSQFSRPSGIHGVVVVTAEALAFRQTWKEGKERKAPRGKTASCSFLLLIVARYTTAALTIVCAERLGALTRRRQKVDGEEWLFFSVKVGRKARWLPDFLPTTPSLRVSGFCPSLPSTSTLPLLPSPRPPLPLNPLFSPPTSPSPLRGRDVVANKLRKGSGVKEEEKDAA